MGVKSPGLGSHFPGIDRAWQAAARVFGHLGNERIRHDAAVAITTVTTIMIVHLLAHSLFPFLYSCSLSYSIPFL